MTSFPIRGGLAVITGAASGIGAALAANLAGRGCDLALADLNAGPLESVAAKAREAGVKASAHRLDVSDADAVAALPAAVLAEHGRVSILVNNAGVSLGGTFEQVSDTDFEWVININFWGVVRMTRAFLPALRQAPTAQLVNISSLFGLVAPPGQTAYAASKFAVRGFTESLRHETDGTALGVTVVHPGGVRTSIATNARRGNMSNTEVAEQSKLWTRMLRLPPESAAEQIASGIARRAKRVLVGNDARQVALIQRLFPVSYWGVVTRLTGQRR